MKPKRKLRLKRARHLRQLRREASNKKMSVVRIHAEQFNKRI